MKPKQIELLAFNKRENLQYEGCCKLRLAVVSNLLIVEPFDEECKMISASFNWKYIMQKSANNSLNNIKLERLLIPIMEAIKSNTASSQKLEKILIEWISKLDEKTKESYVNLLKENNISDFIAAKQTVEKEKSCAGDKRRYSQMNNKNGRIVKGIVMIDLCKDESGDYYVRATNQKHICDPKKYEPEKYEPRKPMDPTEYFYFRPNDKPKSLKKVTIKHYFEKDGNEYVVSNLEKHLCKPFSVAALKQSGIKILKRSGLSAATKPVESKKQEDQVDVTRIVKAPNFELRRDKYGTVDKKLIILHSTDKSLYYELTFCNSKKKYYCARCSSKKHRVYADVEIDKNEEKYVILDKKEHVCEAVKYKPENEIIEAPNFAVFNKDDKKKPTKLVIFTSPEKYYCYQLTLFMNIFWIKEFIIHVFIVKRENQQ